jgi:hypothetical protein
MTDEVKTGAEVVAGPKKTKLRVLKPFVFTHPAEEHTRITSETRFFPGVHEVPDEVANHPWIRAGADGKIESAKQREAREAEEQTRREAAMVDDAEVTARAQAAVGRIAAAEATTGKASKEEIEKELNTPVADLKKKGPGAGVTGK